MNQEELKIEEHAAEVLATQDTPLPVTEKSATDLTFLQASVAHAFCLFRGDLERIRKTVNLKEQYEVLAILSEPKVKKEIMRLEEPMLQQITYDALKVKTPKTISWGDKFKFLELRHKIRGDIKNDGGNKTQVNIGIGYE